MPDLKEQFLSFMACTGFVAPPYGHLFPMRTNFVIFNFLTLLIARR
ncbi:MAG: hypothetical protein Ct9H90mP8_2660 [Pseudomonadota bacterium]|nr:MAG: hypothetical protein Ct9H90mP8_2660 [Pseudomonadota bacterium]